MPKIQNIDADAESPASVTTEDLEAELAEAEALVLSIREQRWKVREETPKGKLLAELAKTDDEFTAAVHRENELRRQIGRLQGRANRRVKVGSASAASEAGKGK